MNYHKIIDEAADFVRTFIKEHQNLDLLYHRLVHTENVVTAVTEIGHHYKLSNRDFFICLVAAWFHDLGYYEDVQNHESVSAKKAEEFLINRGVDEETTNAIMNCILATKVPQNPSNLLEQIVCDADLYHLGTNDFPMHNKLIRKETEAVHHIKIKKDQWLNGTLLLMENHHYHTDYCKDLLNKKKKHNVEKLKKKAEDQLRNINPMDLLLNQYIKNIPKEIEEKSEIPEPSDRGTDTLFRIASGISQRLNEQADTKAHILISVSAIIISVFLGTVMRKAEIHSYLTAAVVMFLTVNLLTIIFSILSTRPSVSKGTFAADDMDANRVNLLFFGNFYNMNFDDYSKGMLQVIGDKHHLYLTLIKNLYDQGVVLGKKYRLLKIAYNVFMFGMVVSVISFFMASKFSHSF